MRNVPDRCIEATRATVIKFEEKKSLIRFHNPGRLLYKRVQIDGCAILEGKRCDNLLCSSNGEEERFVELKGSDISHAIEQLRASIQQIGECDRNRHAYVVCTKVAPQLTTLIQRTKSEFKRRFNAMLSVKESPADIVINEKEA